MADIRYKSLGGDLRISDIVFAGSHDASITTGSSYAKTQDKSVYQQAKAGVRIFDLRILAHQTPDGKVSLVGYHGSTKGEGSGKFRMRRTGNKDSIDFVTGISGEFGLKLSRMLKDAKKFVEKTDEFLIFKFDKCTNYKTIADYCISLLGTAIFISPANVDFSKLTLDQLGGKVVCVFNAAEMQAAGLNCDGSNGILGFLNLNGDPPGQYKQNYTGLQYYGKGGTRFYAFWKTNAGKMNENRDKQKKLMAKMSSQQEQSYTNALGMMYWTSTGSVSNIETRNNKMWKDPGVAKMKRMWGNCLETAIEAQLDSDDAKYMDYANGSRIKSFFPNIIMIDFADETKCAEIFSLNVVAKDKLGAAFQNYGKDV